MLNNRWSGKIRWPCRLLRGEFSFSAFNSITPRIFDLTDDSKLHGAWHAVSSNLCFTGSVVVRHDEENVDKCEAEHTYVLSDLESIRVGELILPTFMPGSSVIKRRIASGKFSQAGNLHEGELGGRDKLTSLTSGWFEHVLKNKCPRILKNPLNDCQRLRTCAASLRTACRSPLRFRVTCTTMSSLPESAKHETSLVTASTATHEKRITTRRMHQWCLWFWDNASSRVVRLQFWWRPFFESHVRVWECVCVWQTAASPAFESRCLHAGQMSYGVVWKSELLLAGI